MYVIQALAEFLFVMHNAIPIIDAHKEDSDCVAQAMNVGHAGRLPSRPTAFKTRDERNRSAEGKAYGQNITDRGYLLKPA
jgi:hypothetical protein